jgi:hypothetical protein
MTAPARQHGAELAALVGGWLADRLAVAGADTPVPHLGGLLYAYVLDAWREPAPPEAPPPLATILERFGLSPFETECLLACLAAAVDVRVERALAAFAPGGPPRSVDAHVLMTLFAPEGEQPLRYRRWLLPDAHLMRAGILGLVDGHDRAVRIELGVLRFLLEEPGPDPELRRLARPSPYPAASADLWAASTPIDEATEAIAAFLRGASVTSRLALLLVGRKGSGQRFLAETACARHGLGLLPIDCRALAAQPQPDRVVARAFRDAAMYGSPLLLEDADALDDPRAAETVALLERLQEERGWLIFVDTVNERLRWFPPHRRVVIQLGELDRDRQRRAWMHQLRRTALPPAEIARIAETMAAKFRLTAGDIALTWEACARHERLLTDAVALGQRLHQEAAAICAPVLGELARKVIPIHRWPDIVLPERKLELLRDIVRQVDHRRKVMEQWGFAAVMNRSLGLNVLFSGPPGTGKTMAAEILSAELQMDLYRINLAAVVSKYIGETEKNLAQIFAQAENANLILFFDEADALFGRRSEVKDAHDRYANIEVNYLLQQMEAYCGIAILATNARQHLDEAFIRRMHIAVDFPQPSPHDRLQIWQKCLPAPAPRAVDLDFEFLAERFELTGASIRSIALTAAYLAADAGDGAIGMAALVQATQRELEKTGRRLVKNDFGPYAVWLDGRAAPAAAAGRT